MARAGWRQRAREARPREVLDLDQLRDVPGDGAPEEDVLRGCLGRALYWAVWLSLRDEQVDPVTKAAAKERHDRALRAGRAAVLKEQGRPVAEIVGLLEAAGHAASERTVQADLARVRWLIHSGQLAAAASRALPSVPARLAERASAPTGHAALSPVDRLLVNLAEGDREDEAARRVREAASYREQGSYRW